MRRDGAKKRERTAERDKKDLPYASVSDIKLTRVEGSAEVVGGPR